MSPQVKAWQPELNLVRTLYGGWESVWAQRNRFLPPHPKEDAEDYAIRSGRPTYYNMFGRTVRALAGTVFQQSPELAEVPPDIQEIFEDDIDLQGTKGIAFCQHAFTDALATGLSGILVDMPEFAGGTLREQRDFDIRPFWTLYRKDDIVSFRVDVVNGKTVLGQLVLHEIVDERQGNFGVRQYEHWRVFRRTDTAVTFETWERTAKTGRLARSSDVGTFRGVTEIPWAPIYTARDDFMCSPPPLVDLANLNLLHYQVNADLHHAVHIANVPIIVTVGFDGELQIGPNRSINFPAGSDGAAHWMETTGAALGSTRAILADIEAQCAALGLGMLQRKGRAAETAEKASLDRKDQDSTLGAMVSDLEDGIELALYYTAQFMGDPDGKGGRLEFSREFETQPAAADRTENQGAPKGQDDPKKTPQLQPTD